MIGAKNTDQSSGLTDDVANPKTIYKPANESKLTKIERHIFWLCGLGDISNTKSFFQILRYCRGQMRLVGMCLGELNKGISLAGSL